MSIIGFVIAVISFLFGISYLLDDDLLTNSNSSYKFIGIIVTFFAGVQLFGLGLLGEYVGRIYDEVKGRPKYIVDKKINFEK